MRKLLIFLAVLFVSVMSSACINNFAIQELNTKAKEYLDKGDYDEAVKRLESSVDLDGSVFETRYNLAVAYVNKEEFKSAINQLNEAIKINPESADAYYTLGVALEGDGYKKLNDKKNIKDNDSTLDDKEVDETSLFNTKEDADYAIKRLEEAIGAYTKYTEIAQKAQDLDKVKQHIKEIQEDIEEYSKLEFPEINDTMQSDNKQ